MSTLSERLKEAIAEKGCKLIELAIAAGVKAPSVSDWLSGETKALKAATAIRAAKFLGVSVSWLTEGTGPKRPGHDATSEAVVSATPIHKDALTIDIERISELFRMMSAGDRREVIGYSRALAQKSHPARKANGV